MNDHKRTQPFLPRWFTIWFYLSCALLLVGGIIDERAGATKEGFTPWAAAVAILGLYLVVCFIRVHRETFQKLFNFPAPLLVKSVLIGWFFAELDELVNYPFNPLVPGISLAHDIILTTPIYLFAHLSWYVVLKRYHLTSAQALIVGGTSLGIYEAVLGMPSPMIIVVLPFMIMIHGVHMVMPAIMLGDRFAETDQKEGKTKYLVGIVFPAIGTAVGIAVASLLGAAFQ